MSDEATDEDMAKARELLRGGNPLTIGLQIKLLARLERVEEELETMRLGYREFP